MKEVLRRRGLRRRKGGFVCRRVGAWAAGRDKQLAGKDVGGICEGATYQRKQLLLAL